MTQPLQITNCKTSRIGEIVVMKEITDINTINSPPTNQVNRPSETQAPASCGPTPSNQIQIWFRNVPSNPRSRAEGGGCSRYVGEAWLLKLEPRM